MQDHWGNNKSIYVYNGDGEETLECKKIDRMNNLIHMTIQERIIHRQNRKKIFG